MENELKQYELICILEPHMEEADLDNFKSSFEKNISNLGGKIINLKDAEKRNLAYPINKQSQGIYIVSRIEIEPIKVTELSKELKTNNQVLRHIINYWESLEAAEKPRTIKKTTPVYQKSKPTKEKPIDKEDLKLEEIDKKLDELVGL